jgi:hypothetical protein
MGIRVPWQHSENHASAKIPAVTRAAKISAIANKK